MAASQTALTPCQTDPDRSRWQEWPTNRVEREKLHGELRQLCRGCPDRWQCARNTVETEIKEPKRIWGMYSAIWVPAGFDASGEKRYNQSLKKRREHAFAQLSNLAEYGGYAVRQQP
jgi:hypothetical protein